MAVERLPGAREAVFAQLSEAGRSEQVAQRLSDAIILGVLPSGDRLPTEQDLAKRFGVALITVREGLGILRDAGLIETRRGREGGSFITNRPSPRGAVLAARLRGLARIDISDMAVYFATVAAGSAERAARQASADDANRLADWLAGADFSTAAAARSNAGGFHLELAVLSQSPRLVREQISLQADFGPLLLLSMMDAPARARVAAENAAIVAAVAAHDSDAARALVSTQIQELATWLLAAKTTIERGGHLHDSV